MPSQLSFRSGCGALMCWLSSDVSLPTGCFFREGMQAIRLTEANWLRASGLASAIGISGKSMSARG